MWHYASLYWDGGKIIHPKPIKWKRPEPSRVESRWYQIDSWCPPLLFHLCTLSIIHQKAPYWQLLHRAKSMAGSHWIFRLPCFSPFNEADIDEDAVWWVVHHILYCPTGSTFTHCATTDCKSVKLNLAASAHHRLHPSKWERQFSSDYFTRLGRVISYKNAIIALTSINIPLFNSPDLPQIYNGSRNMELLSEPEATDWLWFVGPPEGAYIFFQMYSIFNLSVIKICLGCKNRWWASKWKWGRV